MIEGGLPTSAKLGFYAVFLVLAVAAAISKQRRLHEVFVAIMAVLFSVFIGLLFARLAS